MLNNGFYWKTLFYLSAPPDISQIIFSFMMMTAQWLRHFLFENKLLCSPECFNFTLAGNLFTG